MGILIAALLVAAVVASEPEGLPGPLMEGFHTPPGQPGVHFGEPMPGGAPGIPPAKAFDPNEPMTDGKPAAPGLVWALEQSWDESVAPWGCQWLEVGAIATELPSGPLRIEVSVWVAGEWSSDGGDTFHDTVEGGTVVTGATGAGGTIEVPQGGAGGACGGQGQSFHPMLGLRILPRAAGGLRFEVKAQGYKRAELTLLVKVRPE